MLKVKTFTKESTMDSLSGKVGASRNKRKVSNFFQFFNEIYVLNSDTNSFFLKLLLSLVIVISIVPRDTTFGSMYSEKLKLGSVKSEYVTMT